MNSDLTDRLRRLERGGTVENPKALLRDAIDEIELLRSIQGLSVQIPEHGEWGSETLGYLFMDFGIRPGDGYHQAVARHGDMLRELDQLRNWQRLVAEAVDIEAGIGQAYRDPAAAYAWMRELAMSAGVGK